MGRTAEGGAVLVATEVTLVELDAGRVSIKSLVDGRRGQKRHMMYCVV